ncbi:acyl-CoA synthetase family protein [Polluticaenibacter yanchengensis]|uniref:Acyl transferase n=1 Tax=Polluticaenibacter yanchengensis TaxID=3014562 RepID=A0ABT4UH82_9BACT|nr:acyl transferase [Chitinophagaceae bacterium LY-5]
MQNLIGAIFNESESNFKNLALEVYGFQQQNNNVYRDFAKMSNRMNAVTSLKDIPFLPISLFKTHEVKSYDSNTDIVFTSSSTTGTGVSKHYVHDVNIYEQSFIKGFEHFYGDIRAYAFVCLLPSYLERSGSSLIYMAEKLIALSGDADSGFYLKATDEMISIIHKRESLGKKTILLGVTFALLDFASGFKKPLKHTIVMETGGMKGRRKEMTRTEVHEELTAAFGTEDIHSEYGMTELLGQAYSKGKGIYTCSPWMKVFIRSYDDPFDIKEQGTGVLCIADLSNIYSCSFIETQDLATIHLNGDFEILGRLDNSDIRGCSLLTV